MKKLSKLILSVVVLLLIQGCMNTPTVPVPPPEMTSVVSDQNGVATVTGPSGTAGINDIVLVYNETWGVGVMELVEEADGSFSIEIEADPGDQLIVQVKRDNRLSREEGRIVPTFQSDTESSDSNE